MILLSTPISLLKYSLLFLKFPQPISQYGFFTQNNGKQIAGTILRKQAEKLREDSDNLEKRMVQIKEKSPLYFWEN